MTDFLTFQQLLEVLGSKVTTGMSIEEFTKIAIRNGFGQLGEGGLWFNYAAQQSSISSIVSSSASASELWATSGAVASSSASATVAAGSATTTIEAVTSLPTAAQLVTTAEGASTVTTGAGTILGVSTSTFMAAVAPVLGVAIGAGAYKANPQFWTEASMAIAPFLYDKNDTVASVMIANGEMYFPEEAINALADFFTSKGIYTTSLVFPEEVLSGEYLANLYVQNILPIEPAIASAFASLQEAIGNQDNIYHESTERALQNLSLAVTDEKFMRLAYGYPDNVKALFVGCKGTYNPTILIVYDLKVGDKVNESNRVLDSATLGTRSATGDLSSKMYREEYYWKYRNGVTLVLLFNGKVESGTPEDTNIISDNHKPDVTNRKEFITGIDENGKPVTKPYIPVKLPSSKDGSSTSTKEDSQKPSTDDATLPFIIDLINDQKKPKPNPDYKPNANPSNKPNTSTSTPPNVPTIPNMPIAPPKDPTDNGSTPPIVIPATSSADGLITVYNPTSDELKQFGKWLWTTWSSDILDTLSKMFNNPMEGVIGLHELYATPSTGSSTTIKCGYLDSGVSSLLVDKRYTSINCGSMIIPEYWNNYLDYAPYTTVNCYLPFIGMVELEAKDVIGCAINITYTIDSYNGSCIAQVTTAKESFNAVTYQFSGNCAVEVPISSGNYSSILSTAIGLGASGLATYFTGGAAAPMLAGATASMMKTGSNVSHSGSFGASHGAMGIKKPFIEVKSKIQKKVPNYNDDYGYPAHHRVTVSKCSGYLKVNEVNVISSSATSEEKKMIEELLKSGVYVD